MKKGNERKKSASAKGKKGKEQEVQPAASPSPAAAPAPVEPVVPNSPVSFSVGDTRMQLTHGGLLNDQTFSDLVFSFSNPKYKKVVVGAHKVIVKVRAPNLLQEGKFISKLSFKKGKYETVINEATLPRLGPEVLQLLLRYVYFGDLDLDKLSLPLLLNLTSTAVALSIDALVWHCEHSVRGKLNAETVHIILAGAEERQLESVKRIALAFSFAQWDSFIGNKEGAKILGLELFQSVSAEYARGIKVEDVEAPRPENSVVADYRRIYEEMPEPDLAIVAGAERIPCHRAILAMYSDVLANAFKGMKFVPGQPQPFQLSPQLESPQAVDSFLRFVYYGESKMEALDAAEMITKVNANFRLSTFQFLCEHTIISDISTKSALQTLGVTYIQGLQEKPHIKALRKQTLAFIIAHFAEINLDPIRTLNPLIQTDLLFNVQRAVKNGHLGNGNINSGASDSSHTPRSSGVTPGDTGEVDIDEAAPDEVVVGASDDEGSA